MSSKRRECDEKRILNVDRPEPNANSLILSTHRLKNANSDRMKHKTSSTLFPSSESHIFIRGHFGRPEPNATFRNNISRPYYLEVNANSDCEIIGKFLMLR